MKKIILFLTLAGSILAANAQVLKSSNSSKYFKNKEKLTAQSKALVDKPAQSNLWYWERPGNYWSLKTRTEYTYNAAGLVSTILQKDSLGNYLSREHFVYQDTLLKEHLVESWFMNAWINNTRVKLWYDAEGNPTKEVSEIWNTIDNQWEVFFGFSTGKTFDPTLSLETVYDSLYDVNLVDFVLSQKTERYYNAHNLVDSELFYMAMFSSTLDPYYKHVFTYNAALQQDTIVEYLWTGSEWMGDRMVHRILYDTLNRVVDLLYSNWDGNSWRTSGNTMYEYLNYNGVITTDFVKPGVTFVNYQRNTYENDSLYNQIRVKFEDWDGVNWVSTLHETSNYEYFQGGIIKEKLVQMENEQGEMINEVKTEFFYGIGIGLNTVKHLQLQVFPNPSTDIITVKGLNKDQLATLTIMDLHGKKVFEKEVQEEARIDVSSLKAGIYVLRVGASVVKIVVSR